MRKKIVRIDPEFLDDIFRITTALQMAGYLVTHEESFDLWSEYSADWFAGWLTLPDDNNVLVESLEGLMARNGYVSKEL